MSKNKKKSKTKKQQKSFFTSAFKWFFVLCLWLSLPIIGVVIWYGSELPAITQDISFERKTAITIQASDGSTLTRYGEMKGNNITVQDVPPYLVNAIIAIEDRRFYNHFGLDFIGISRAMVENIEAGRIVQGGSTITQQLAKNLFLNNERTFKRKIQEVLLAFWLEHELTKDEILTAYMNRVYMGAGNYGLDAASEFYFDKPIQNITLREAAILAGLLKAPNTYAPHRNPGLARKRSDIVLAAMAEEGYISENQAKDLSKLPPAPRSKPSGAGGAARYFTDWILDGLKDLIGSPQKDIIIQTTLNPKIQEQAEKSLTAILRQHGSDYKIGQGAILVMAHDGAVLAMVGGADYGISQFNRITQAKRQPGSSFKPIVYLTALAQGWDPNDRILDAPFEEGSYKPENFKNEYRGEVTLTEALAYSMNTAAVRLMETVGRQNVVNTARVLGIISPLEGDLSLALGSSSVSPLEMAIAYTAFANNGYAAFPYGITKITNDEDMLYYIRQPVPNPRKLISDQNLSDLNEMLEAVVNEGTGRGAQMPFFAAGKTGTSQKSRDAWFIGYTDKFVAVVWLGNDDNTPMKGVTGGRFPAQIWAEIIRYAHQNTPEAATTLAIQKPRNSFERMLDRLINN